MDIQVPLVNRLTIRAPVAAVVVVNVCGASVRSELHFSQERRLARISISIVWLFMFCHAWRAVPTLYEAANSPDGLEVSRKRISNQTWGVCV